MNANNNNNMNTNNNNNLDTNPSQDDYEEANNGQITLIFRRNKKEKNIDFTIKIICKIDELVKNVLDRYCFKTMETKIRKDLLFFFNSIQLNKNENKTLEQVGIQNMSRIYVIDGSGIVGGTLL